MLVLWVNWTDYPVRVGRKNISKKFNPVHIIMDGPELRCVLTPDSSVRQSNADGADSSASSDVYSSVVSSNTDTGKDEDSLRVNNVIAGPASSGLLDVDDSGAKLNYHRNEKQTQGSDS